MSKKGIFYGSSSGNTKSAAFLIAQALDIDTSDVIDVAQADVTQMLGYDSLLLGSSTWGYGDLQDDWDGFLSKFEKLDLSGKKIAIVGTGDSSSYPETFCDSIGILAESTIATGATLIGTGVDSSDYIYDSSRAIMDDAFCGLPLDDDNESDKTDSRIAAWVEQLKSEGV